MSSTLDILLHIVSAMAHPLNKKDLSSCCLVSRHWYETFAPFLWKHLDFRRDTSDDFHWNEQKVLQEKEQQAHDLMLVLQKNEQWIQSLHVSSDVTVKAILLLSEQHHQHKQKLQGPDLNNSKVSVLSHLQGLSFDDRLNLVQRMEASLFLLQQCRALKSITLRTMDLATRIGALIFTTCLPILSQSKSLATFSISLQDVHHDNVQDLLRNLPQSLRSLDVSLAGNCIRTRLEQLPVSKKKEKKLLRLIGRAEQRPHWILYTALAAIKFQCRLHEVTIQALPLFLASCPVLTTLTLSELNESSLSEIGPALATCCPRLQHLKLQDSFCEDNSLVEFLKSCSKTKGLFVQPWRLLTFVLDTTSYLHYDGAISVLVHGCNDSLEHISFGSRVVLPSNGIQLMLRSFPRLKSFAAKVVMLSTEPNRNNSSLLVASEIVQGMMDAKSWICLSIQSLELDILDDSSITNQSSSMVFAKVSEQMASLKYLRTKNVRWWSHNKRQRSVWPYYEEFSVPTID